MDVAAIQAKYGVTPPQLIDVKSLMGDASDNIPGVAGIGEKTALSLVQKFGSLAGVYEHIEDKAIKPKQRENLVNHRQDAEMSLMLGTIRKDAPIETDPARYTRSGGDSAAAAQSSAALEKCTSWRNAGAWMSLRPQCPRPIWRQVEAQPLPLVLTGRYFVAQVPSKDGNGAWYAVQNQPASAVFCLDDASLAALLDSDAQVWAFDAKPLYRKALTAGGVGRAIRFDGKLAAYLLNPSASKYEVSSLAAEYGAVPSFVCTEFADAGVLPALLEALRGKLEEQGMAKLHDEMELPLARVLADMERIGFAVDADGIRQFGVGTSRGTGTAARPDL